MGQQTSMLSDLACRDWARFVFNSCHLHSKCSNCCEVDVDTDLVSVQSSEEEEEALGCCA